MQGRFKYEYQKMKSLVILFFVFLNPTICFATLYEDAEDGDTSGNVPPTVYGWAIYDNTPAGSVISNVYDADKDSRVIKFVGPGNTNNGYVLGYWYPGDVRSWNNTTEFNVHWCSRYSTNFVVYMRVYTTIPNPLNGSLQRYVYYTAVDSDYGLSSNKTYIHHGLGSDKRDGQWYSFNRDLLADLQEFEPGNTITHVTAFLIRGSGKVDDIHLTPLPMKPVLNLKKTVQTLYDPINLSSNPKAIPGSVLEYTLKAENFGFMQADNNTTILQDNIPANMKTCVSNIGQCKKPYLEAVTNSSGMSLGAVTYKVGGVFVASPPADVDGFNANVTAIKVSMNGVFPDVCSGAHSFEVKFRTGMN